MHKDTLARKLYQKEYYLKHRVKKLGVSTERYKVKRGDIKTYHQRQREKVLQHYGAVCTCCGEKELGFLSVDHLYGGGNQHRTSLGRSGTTFYRWLIKSDYPTGYQILCHNCNMAKGFYKECPHQSMMREVGGLA